MLSNESQLKRKSLAHETHEASLNNNLITSFTKSQLHVIMKTEPSYTFQQLLGQGQRWRLSSLSPQIRLLALYEISPMGGVSMFLGSHL